MSNRLRLLFLSDARAEHTRRWTTYFASRGHDVSLLTWNPDVLPGYGDVSVTVLRKHFTASSLVSRAANVPFMVRELRKVIRRFQPMVVHAHSAGAYGWMAFACGFRPYIITPWGTDVIVDARNSLLHRMFTKTSFRSASLLVTDARHLKNDLAALGARPECQRVVMFGTDTSKFRPAQRPRQTAGGCVVISTRTLHAAHDVETFVRSIPLVLSGAPQTQFLIAGDGRDRVRLEALVDELGVRQRVRFLGYLSEDGMAAALQSADIYVSTSQHDAGLAASTGEAMACGLAIVHSDNSDNEYWAREGQGGVLFETGSPRDLAAAILKFAQDPDLREQAAERNRAKALAEYDYETEMSRMEKIYLELSAVSHPRTR